MGRAARAKALRREQRTAVREAVREGRVEVRGHDHRLTCRECQLREDVVARLAHRVRQQNEQIVKLHELLDKPPKDRPEAFTAPAGDRSLPGRRPSR